MKEYSYMDEASLRKVDMYDGLESMLAILGHKLSSKPGQTRFKVRIPLDPKQRNGG